MISFNKYVLSNGLKLLHHYNATTQMVALNLRYDVGARDENPERTGLAHLFEHLMFGGSANAPDFDGALQAAGGSSNAWTGNDCTNFYEVLPAHNIETAFWLESDRYLNLCLDEQSVATQKSVVIEEFKQRYLNRPYGDVSHLMRSLAYKSHPYRWPVIGVKPEHIAEASMQEIEDFYNTHYSIDRMVLCVSGNVTFQRAVELTEKWFGDLAPRASRKRDLPVEPAQTQPRVLKVHSDVPENMIVRIYHMCGANDPDFVASDLVSDVLANGPSARFHRNVLMTTDLFTELDAVILGCDDPGLLYVTARLANGVDAQKALDVIDGEIDKLLREGVSERELKRYANQHVARELNENILYDAVAEKLCKYEMLGDASRINTENDEYQTVTVDHFNRVARELFRAENCSTLYYGPMVNE
ncbi:MAG: M16 family metallopeptidase [Muribaculaceae bacterium]